MLRKSASVIGGGGALGSCVVNQLKLLGWTVSNVDFKPSKQADANFEMGHKTLQELTEWHNGKLRAVVHVAGGFAMGGLNDGIDPVKKMWEMNGESAFTSAHFASQLLQDDGLLILTGAKGVYDGPLSFAVGYGMAKAGVHHLAQSYQDSIKGTNKRVVCILPTTIDTPANRVGMPDADFSTWTSPEDIATRIGEWAENPQTIPTLFVTV